MSATKTELYQDEIDLFLTYIEKDINYYKNGIETLSKVKQAKDNVEFEQLLDKYKLDPNWTMDDINTLFDNTSKLVTTLLKVQFQFLPND